MKNLKSLFSLLITTISLGLAAFAHADASMWTGTCKVAFSGKSTLHNFAGTVECEEFTVTITDIDNPENAKATSEVTVKAEKMDTANKKRDIAMLKCLDAATYPEIKVSVKDLSAEATQPKWDGAVPQPTVIPFSLLLTGKELQLTGAVSDWTYAEDSISCTVTFPVSLSAAGIKPPSILGLVKVNDEITVQAKLSLARQ